MNAAALRKIAYGFREARALHAGVELGVFEAIGRGQGTAAELADELDADPRGLRVLLDALAELGILERAGQGYALAAGAADVLLPEGAEYLGNLLVHDLWHWPSWTDADAAVRAGAPAHDRSRDRYLGSPAVVRGFLANYTRAMEQSGRELVAPLSERIAALEPRVVCDLGGGSGALLLAVLERLPRARGYLVDHPFALERARELAEQSPAGKRMEICPLDLERDALPQGADVAVLCRVLMGFPPERARALLQRCAQALPEQGRLLIHDYRARSRVGALMSLDVLLNTGGEVHAGSALEGWLAPSGFSLRELRPRIVPYMTTWLAERG